ncbi:hypothetical protein [Azospirillum argentinense]
MPLPPPCGAWVPSLPRWAGEGIRGVRRQFPPPPSGGGLGWGL